MEDRVYRVITRRVSSHHSDLGTIEVRTIDDLIALMKAEPDGNGIILSMAGDSDDADLILTFYDDYL